MRTRADADPMVTEAVLSRMVRTTCRGVTPANHSPHRSMQTCVDSPPY